MSIIAVFNQKGGVGKTTTALNLATALIKTGRSTYALDFDPQAHLSSIVGAVADSGNDTALSLFQRNRCLHELVQQSNCQIKIIPSNSELSKVDALFGKGYNIVNRLHASLQTENIGKKDTPLIIDCCPMVGVLSLNALIACDGVIIPIAADHLSAKGAIQLEKTLAVLQHGLNRRIPRRFLLTRFDVRRRMAWDVLRLMEEHFGKEVCKTSISENVSLAESPGVNMSVFDYAPKSRGAQDYDDLATELVADGFIE
jgi:chromosome partitioning protein